MRSIASELEVIVINNLDIYPQDYVEKFDQITQIWLHRSFPLQKNFYLRDTEYLKQPFANFITAETKYVLFLSLGQVIKNGNSIDDLVAQFQDQEFLGIGDLSLCPSFFLLNMEKCREFMLRDFFSVLSSRRACAEFFFELPENTEGLYDLKPTKNPEELRDYLFGNNKDIVFSDSDQKQFFEQNTVRNNKKSIFAFNTESLDFQAVANKPIENLFSVAAGFKPYYILWKNGFAKHTRVNFFDYSKNSLLLKKYLLENWDGENYSTILQDFLMHHDLDEAVLCGSLSEVDQNMREVHQAWGSKHNWLVFWSRYKKLEHRFFELDLINNNETLLQRIKEKKDEVNYFWWSNIFNVEATHYENDLDTLRDKFQNFYTELLSADKDIYVDGMNCMSQYSIGSLNKVKF